MVAASEALTQTSATGDNTVTAGGALNDPMGLAS
jgi:hypothetical protein